MKKTLHNWRAAGTKQEAAAPEAAATTTTWTSHRTFTTDDTVDPLCPRCGKEPETDLHRIWTRECNKGHPDYENSQHLLRQAISGVEHSPVLWLRGLVPAQDAQPRQVPPELAPTWTFGLEPGQRIRASACLLEAFGDGVLID